MNNMNPTSIKGAPQFQAVDALRQGGAPSSAMKTNEKLPTLDAALRQQADKPQTKLEGGKDFIDKSTLASLKTGAGTGLIIVGATAAILLAPLTITGGLLGAGFQKLAHSAGIVDKSNTNILKAGLVIGSLGTLGLAMVGSNLLQSGKEMKADLQRPPVNEKSASDSAKTEKSPANTTENAAANRTNESAPKEPVRKEAEIFADIKPLKELKNKVENTISDHRNELRETESQKSHYTLIRDNSLESIDKDNKMLNERINYYSNQPNSSFSALFKEYEGKKTVSEKEQFVSDLQKSKNGHAETFQVIQDTRSSMQRELKDATNMQAQINKSDQTIIQIKDKIVKEEGNLKLVNNKEESFHAELANISIKEILGRFSDPDQAMQALSAEYQKQGKYLNQLQEQNTNTLETASNKKDLQEQMTVKTIRMQQIFKTMAELNRALPSLRAAAKQALEGNLGSPLSKTGPVLSKTEEQEAKTISEDETLIPGGSIANPKEVDDFLNNLNVDSGRRAPLEKQPQVAGTMKSQAAETVPAGEILKANKLSVTEELAVKESDKEAMDDFFEGLDKLFDDVDKPKT